MSHWSRSLRHEARKLSPLLTHVKVRSTGTKALLQRSITSRRLYDLRAAVSKPLFVYLIAKMYAYSLCQSQIEEFHEQGYLVLRASEHNLVKSEELRQWTTQVREWPKSSGKWMPYYEVVSSGEKQLMRTEKFVDYHAEFERLLCGGELRSILAQLSGDVCLTTIDNRHKSQLN